APDRRIVVDEEDLERRGRSRRLEGGRRHARGLGRTVPRATLWTKDEVCSRERFSHLGSAITRERRWRRLSFSFDGECDTLLDVKAPIFHFNEQRDDLVRTV